MLQTNMAVAGVDVSKAKLDVAVYGTELHWQVSNDAAGWRDLAARLRKCGVGKVGLEATGSYSRGVSTRLRADGFQVVMHQPIQVKAFAVSRLRRAKNDRLDAALIAAFTALWEGPVREAPDPRLAELADLLVFIEQAEADMVRAKTRLEHQPDARLRRLLESDIKRAKQRRDRELARLEAMLRRHADLGERLDLVLSVPGIGPRTAMALIVDMPELGRASREEVAALAGLAPFDQDSGEKKGTRHIGGGRARVRTSLYAAALPAAFRWNEALRAIYKRLTEAGKTHKQALIACARKLLIYANTVVERGTPWQTEHAKT